MRTYLELVGFKVSEAADGLEAIERACSSVPDVIVLDLAMPRMNGFEAARKLHEIVPKSHLVLFTSYREVVDRPEAPDVGIEKIVAKDEGIDTLVRNIRDLLKTAA